MPDEEKFTLEEDRLLTLFNMRAEGEVKVEDVQMYLNVSRNTATRRLSRLIDNGDIKRIGKGPAVRYVKNT